MLNKIINKISAQRKISVMKEFYSQFISNGDLTFDIGANVGGRTKMFSQLGTKVIAVEPVEHCYNILKDTFEDNKSVTIINSALGRKVGKGKIFISDQHEVSTMSTEFIENYKNQQKHSLVWDMEQEVNVITLDQMIADFGLPQFCKIDVEGFELEVIKGLSHILPHISFEYNSKLKTNSLDCLEVLSANENYYYNFSPYETFEFSLIEWIDVINFSKFIKELPDEIETGDIYVKHIA